MNVSEHAECKFPSIVVPVYNGAESIRALVERLSEVLAGQFQQYQFVLVNDGSADNSDQVIRQVLADWPELDIIYANLAKNFGEHNAVMSGLNLAEGDCAVIIDDDFQNPPGEIIKLLNMLQQGHDVVYSYYTSKQHAWYRNMGSRFNGWVAELLLDKPKGLYLSSFKALNRFAIDQVTEYRGPFPYIDGLILRTTRNIGTVLCEHSPREMGKSNYTLRKLISLWLSMFTSFSVVPLRLSTYMGFTMAAVGMLMTLYFLLSWSTGGFGATDIPKGWASIIVSVTIFAGIQLVVVGMVGEYMGRVFMTLNGHPQYVTHDLVRSGGDAQENQRE